MNEVDAVRPGGGDELKSSRLTITLEESLKCRVVGLARRSERSVSNYVRALLWDHVNVVTEEIDEG